MALIAAEWEAGRLAREKIPEVATAMLVAGYDSDALRVTAGLIPAELDEAHEWFGKVLRELGFNAARDQTRRGVALAEEYARRVLDGRMSVYDGAYSVFNLWSDFPHDAALEIDAHMGTLIALCDEWEQFEEDRNKRELQMKAELRAFLRETGGSDIGRFACACCGFHTLTQPADGSYELCPVCWWEDDGVQLRDLDYAGGANEPSLRQARENFRAFGASDRAFLRTVRPPRPVERP